MVVLWIAIALIRHVLEWAFRVMVTNLGQTQYRRFYCLMNPFIIETTVTFLNCTVGELKLLRVDLDSGYFPSPACQTTSIHLENLYREVPADQNRNLAAQEMVRLQYDRDTVVHYQCFHHCFRIIIWCSV